MSQTKTKPTVNASGLNGNTLSVLAACTKALEQAGMRDEAKELRSKALTGDYNHALATMMEYVDFTFGKTAPTRDRYGFDFDDDAPTMPAGMYIVVDPCYVLTREKYDELLSTEAFDDEQVHVYAHDDDGEPQHIVILHTKHGDGEYYSDDGVRQLVDSGTIACIQICPQYFQPDWQKNYENHCYNVAQPFQVQNDEDSVMHFGGFTQIETDDPRCDECGIKGCEPCEGCGHCQNYCECEDEYQDDDYDDEE